MLYSLKKWDRTFGKKNKLWDNTNPLSPHPHPYMNQPPSNLCNPHIIHNNNTMDTEFLVKIRQSNKCGSVRNDKIFNLHLGSGTGPRVSILCLLKDISHIYRFHRPKQLTRKKTKSPELIFNSQQILSYCLRLCTQNPGLRELDLKSSPKRGSDTVNMLK